MGPVLLSCLSTLRGRHSGRRGCGALLSVAVIVTVAGCSRPPPPALVPVEGKVVRNGKPLATVVVRFWPEDEGLQKQITVATATTAEDGRFHVETPPGRYKVTLFAPPKSNLNPQIEGGAPKSSLPPAQSLPSL